MTRKSVVSGILRTIDLNITQEQLDDYNSGTNAMMAFPNLTPDELEFIRTGITPEDLQENTKTICSK